MNRARRSADFARSLLAAAPAAPRFAAALALFAPLGACRPVENQIQIESHHPPAAPQRLSTRFDVGVFHVDAHGELDVVLSAAAPSALEAGAELRQYFWMHIFWQPVPGTTYAERTQTNARMCYALLDADRAISYEGAGFTFLRLSRAGDALDGSIESGTLVPTRIVGQPPDPLGSCLVLGTFTARKSDSQAVAAVAELRRRLGSPPRRTVRETPVELR
ncbi:MAG: hypothetical protein U1A27_11575 [Phycisphaerae bacterium]